MKLTELIDILLDFQNDLEEDPDMYAIVDLHDMQMEDLVGGVAETSRGLIIYNERFDDV